MKIIGFSTKNIIIIFIVIAIVSTLLIFLIDMRTDINKHSDMSLLNAGIREELQDYYKKNDKYPTNLQVLRSSLLKRTYPTKIPEETNIIDFLNYFKYSTDGSSYSITWEVIDCGKIYTHNEKGQGGKSPQCELYINGKLHGENKKTSLNGKV